MRKIQEVHARLIGIDGPFDGHARHCFFAGEEQILISGASARSFLDDLRNGHAEPLPLMFLLERGVSDELRNLIRAQRFAHFVNRETTAPGVIAELFPFTLGVARS